MRLCLVAARAETDAAQRSVSAELRLDGRYVHYRRMGTAGVTVRTWQDVDGTVVPAPVDAVTAILVDEVVDAVLAGALATDGGLTVMVHP